MSLSQIQSELVLAKVIGVLSSFSTRQKSRKILLLKKKQIEKLFSEKPWNEAVLDLLLKKYLVKIEFKSENKSKILRTYF